MVRWLIYFNRSNAMELQQTRFKKRLPGGMAVNFNPTC